jgi:hypothetical protein
VGWRIRIIFRKNDVVSCWYGRVVEHLPFGRARMQYESYKKHPLLWPPPSTARLTVLDARFRAPRRPFTRANRQPVTTRYRRTDDSDTSIDIRDDSLINVSSATSLETVLDSPLPARVVPINVDSPTATNVTGSAPRNNESPSSRSVLTSATARSVAGQPISATAADDQAPQSSVGPAVHLADPPRRILREIRVASFNAKTWKTPERQDALISALALHDIDVCAIQETRAAGCTDETRLGYTILHSGPGKDGRAGVALVLSHRVAVHNSQEIVKSRLLRASVTIKRGRGHHRCIVYAAYFPQRNSSCTSLINALLPHLRHTDPSRPIFLLADANGHDSSVTTTTGFVTCDSVLNDPRPTFIFNGTSSLIDHCFVSETLKHCIRSRHLLQPLPSDHLMVVTSFRASFEHRPTTRTTRPRIDDVAFCWRARKRLDVAFDAIGLPMTTPLSAFPIVLDKLASKYNYNSRGTIEKQCWPHSHTPARAAARDKTITASYVISYISTVKRNPWLAWKYIDASRWKPAQLTGVISADTLATHFKMTMEEPLIMPPIPVQYYIRPSISDSPFSEEELERAVDTMRNHTAPGPDHIPIEAFRVPSMRKYLLAHLNSMAEDPSSIPSAQSVAFLTPVFKKGDTSTPSNYRPIVLMSVVVKVLHKLLLLRIREKLDPYLIPYQAGYRRSLSTSCNVLPIAQLVETAKANSKFPLYLIFCDF